MWNKLKNRNLSFDFRYLCNIVGWQIKFQKMFETFRWDSSNIWSLKLIRSELLLVLSLFGVNFLIARERKAHRMLPMYQFLEANIQTDTHAHTLQKPIRVMFDTCNRQQNFVVPFFSLLYVQTPLEICHLKCISVGDLFSLISLLVCFFFSLYSSLPFIGSSDTWQSLRLSIWIKGKAQHIKCEKQ